MIHSQIMHVLLTKCKETFVERNPSVCKRHQRVGELRKSIIIANLTNQIIPFGW